VATCDAKVHHDRPRFSAWHARMTPSYDTSVSTRSNQEVAVPRYTHGGIKGIASYTACEPTHRRQKGLHAPWSNISPNGPAMPVRRACFLSQASHTPRHPHATPSHSRKGHTPIYRVESLIQEQPDGPSVARRVSTRSAFRPAAAGLNGRCESNARKVHPIWRARRAALLR